MASEIRVDKINSLSGVGTVTLSPTGVDIAGITTAATLKATTGIVTTLTATTGIVTTLTTNTLTANSTAKVGSGVTLSPDGDIFATGVTTATTFVGALTGNVTGNATGLSGSPNVTMGDITIGESILHDGDSDTSVKFPAADVVTINTGGGENTRFATTFNAFKAPDGGNRYYFGGTGNSADAELSLYNASDSQKVRLAANTTSFFSGGGVGLGKDTSGATTDGAFFSNTTNNIVLPSGSYLVFNRNASGAGTLIDWRSQNTSKGGIHFNGTNIAYQSGSNNIFNENGVTFDNGSNYLDDYEEGTWTPALQFDVGSPTITYGTRSGTYTKIGRMVHLQYYMVVSSGTDVNDFFARLSLPFTGIGVGHQDARVRQWNTAHSDWFLSLGGSGPVFFMSNAMGSGTNYARGDDVNGHVLSGQYTLYVS